MHVHTVFLCPATPCDPETLCRKLNTVAEILHAASLKVGVWYSSIGHVSYEGMSFTHMTDPDGAEILSSYTQGGLSCPGEYRYENAKGQRFVVLLLLYRQPSALTVHFGERIATSRCSSQ